MSGKVLFACSKCFSKFYNFDELSSGQQLCKGCRGTTSIQKCCYCRSEYQPATKSQSACKKCEHNLNKYGKPKSCECCKIVAAFGSSKCMRCASYEARYGPPVQCDECKLRSAFDKHDENKKVNGKLLCWLCTCTFKRTLLKAQQDGRISTTKKRPHEKSHRDRDNSTVKKSSRQSDMSKTGGSGAASAVSSSGLDLPDKLMRTTAGNSGNGAIVGLSSIANPTPTTTDPNSADHVVAVTNLKERIASLEKRLQQKDKELLEKDKLLTELKGKNFEKENEMRNKMKEVDRLHDMKVENMNRKVASLLKEIATLKKNNKKNTSKDSKDKEKEKIKEKRENISPKEEVMETDEKDSQDERDDKNSSSSSSRSNSPSTN